MTKPTDIRITNVTTETERIDYRSPIKFGGRVVTDAVLANVVVEVETASGHRGRGFGSMPMGNVWAWPSNAVAPSQSLAAMLEFVERFTEVVRQYRGMGHPLDITRELATQDAPLAAAIAKKLDLAELMPPLAELVAASPFEAAIHDAYGKARAQIRTIYSARNCAARSGTLPDARIRWRISRPVHVAAAQSFKMPLYHLVGRPDPLVDSDINQRLNDNLPETLGEWIVMDGLTHLKIKLNGDDLPWDVERVIGVERVAIEAQAAQGVTLWHYSLDFNEKCASVEYLLDFLRKLEEQSPAALARVHYIEQPTHRDLKKHPENKMHKAAAIKPVVIDESLIDLESLQLAREQGYSGVALKACKGQRRPYDGAAAQKYGMFLCVQDLSRPIFVPALRQHRRPLSRPSPSRGTAGSIVPLAIGPGELPQHVPHHRWNRGNECAYRQWVSSETPS
jgi:pimeloyl-ACP methyl ester carboxylesterase